MVLITNRKSYMSFRLVPKSVTLNDLERRNGVILRYFIKFGQLPGALRKSSRSLSHLLMSSCSGHVISYCNTLPAQLRKSDSAFSRLRQPVQRKLCYLCNSLGRFWCISTTVSFQYQPRTGCEERLRNDLFCVEWDVKP